MGFPWSYLKSDQGLDGWISSPPGIPTAWVPPAAGVGFRHGLTRRPVVHLQRNRCAASDSGCINSPVGYKMPLHSYPLLPVEWRYFVEPLARCRGTGEVQAVLAGSCFVLSILKPLALPQTVAGTWLGVKEYTHWFAADADIVPVLPTGE